LRDACFIVETHNDDSDAHLPITTPMETTSTMCNMVSKGKTKERIKKEREELSSLSYIEKR